MSILASDEGYIRQKTKKQRKIKKVLTKLHKCGNMQLVNKVSK